MRHVNLLSILLSISFVVACSDNSPNRFERDSGVVAPAVPDAPVAPIQCTTPQDTGCGEACGAAPTGQGSACSSTAPCQDATFSYCYPAAGDAGYCTTTGCTAADCAGGYYCDLALTPSVCRRPPTGQGTPCAAPTDCAAFEASYCESAVSKSCLLSGCSEALNNCDSTHLCCDFAWMGLPSLCVDKVKTGGVCYKP
jgi:hypothetical protein